MFSKGCTVFAFWFTTCHLLRPYVCDFLGSRFMTVRISNENLEILETVRSLKMPIKCARECAWRGLDGRSTCDAFEFSDGVCRLYTVGEGVASDVFNTGRQVYRRMANSNLFKVVSVGGKAFSIYQSLEATTYFKARAYCISLGGYLLHIDSLDEYEAINQTVDQPGGYWIGANDMEVEGLWQCEKHGTPLNFSLWLWAPFEPSNSDGLEDCGELTSKRMLNDVNCFWDRHFLCEKTP